MKSKMPHKKPWPTKKAMEQIYDMNLWGTNQDLFYSGSGSHLQIVVEPYIQELKTFLTSFDNYLTIADLGCGDFNIGKQLVQFTAKYTAVDIVPKLIHFNKVNFVADNLEFQCLDLVTDELPQADCAIIRQVLQHLSNQEVKTILNKISQYQYIIITEHIPNISFVPNLDIISGQGIRLKKKSGLVITEPPFKLAYKRKKDLLSILVNEGKEQILTTLYEIR